eukprot:scaffold65788_cov61-Phaeocystis_antarctica.AAC.1
MRSCGCCVIATGVCEERTASRRDDSGRGHARRRRRRGSRRVTCEFQSRWVWGSGPPRLYCRLGRGRGVPSTPRLALGRGRGRGRGPRLSPRRSSGRS